MNSGRAGNLHGRCNTLGTGRAYAPAPRAVYDGAMTTASPTLHYIFDPLCGWCYGAAPLVEAARGISGLNIEPHGGGMMTGSNRQPITDALRRYVMPHDERIAGLTGQPFGKDYVDGLLRDTGAVFDSEPPTTAILAAQTLAGRGLDLLRRLQAEMNMSILFITHNLGVVAEIAHRVAVMYAGRVVEDAGVYDLFEKPTHPYTRGLLSCLPTAALLASGERLRAIPGNAGARRRFHAARTQPLSGPPRRMARSSANAHPGRRLTPRALTRPPRPAISRTRPCQAAPRRPYC